MTSVGMTHWELPILLAAAVISLPPYRSPDIVADITLVGLEIPVEDQLPFLSDGVWVIDGKRTESPKEALLERARKTDNWDGGKASDAAIVVSLGPRDTFGSFLSTMRSLQEMDLCLVFIKEGGRDAGIFDGKAHVETPGIRIC